LRCPHSHKKANRNSPHLFLHFTKIIHPSAISTTGSLALGFNPWYNNYHVPPRVTRFPNRVFPKDTPSRTANRNSPHPFLHFTKIIHPSAIGTTDILTMGFNPWHDIA